MFGNSIFKVIGRAKQVTSSSFVVDDGSGFPITVTAPGHGIHNQDFVQARGIAQVVGGLVAIQSSAAKVAAVH